MKAADIMTSEVITTRPDASVKQAARLMLENGVSALPVVDGKGKLLGIVSEGDLMHRAELKTERQRSWWLDLIAGSETSASEYIKSHAQKVGDVMTRKLITVSPSASLSEIATLLEKHGIKRVPVVERGKLRGIVSRANLLHALASMGKEIKTKAAPAKDSTIRRKVMEKIRRASWRPWLFNATVRNGTVTLWGIVNAPAEKKAARVAAQEVAGVKKVENNLIVRPRGWADARAMVGSTKKR